MLEIAKIKDISLELIDEFPGHPYKVQDDKDMERLVESIKEHGVITPALVRQKENGRYELIAGHRRKRASEIAGFQTLRCDIVELTRDEAIILMVESNYQRTQQLPSERAFAYKMRLEALGRQGKRTDLTCATELHRLEGKKSRDTVSDKSGETVRRYVRLTNLIPELLERGDRCRGRIADGIQDPRPPMPREIQGEHGRKPRIEIFATGLLSTEKKVEVIAHQGIGQYLHPGQRRRNGDIDKRDGTLFVIHKYHTRLQGLRMQVEEGPLLSEQPFQLPFISPRWRAN